MYVRCKNTSCSQTSEIAIVRGGQSFKAAMLDVSVN